MSTGPLRVFLSHTSELRDYPVGGSYVNAAERAVSAAGHVVVDMADFPAADQLTAQMCIDQVGTCDVYIGILGTRYGSPVRDRPEMSYTEVEFDTATGLGLPRLVFLLNTDADDVGIPPAKLIDREFGDRQDAFRRRVGDSGLSRRSFGSPDQLGQLVERSLRNLTETRARVGSGLAREQVSKAPKPTSTSRFVNPPPTTAPLWFQGRRVETRLVAGYLADPGIRLVTVVGRGGVGKTAMICRLLKGLESGRVPDTDLEMRMAGIIYLSQNGVHQVQYAMLVSGLIRLLPADHTERLQGIARDSTTTPSIMIRTLLEFFPVEEPVVVLLDNLESVMDAETETLTEPSLFEALTAVLTAPAHGVTVVATSRVTPAPLLRVESARQRLRLLDRGLESPDAEAVLRELDDDGRLGLRDAPDELLAGLRDHTRGFPRALEAVKAILEGDPSLTPADLLDQTRDLPEDQVVEVLVGQAFELLDLAGQQVMQALAVFPAPVSPVGIDFVLLPFNPTVNAAPILTRLVRRQLAQASKGLFDLHPVDRAYALKRLPSGPDSVFTLSGLRASAADYFATIRTPRESWKSMEDIDPQLAEFDLRCESGDFDSAAEVLADIDFQGMIRWGNLRETLAMHERLLGTLTEPWSKELNHSALGRCYLDLGQVETAIEQFRILLALTQAASDRGGEGNAVARLGDCHTALGRIIDARTAHSEALLIAREVGDLASEVVELGALGTCYVTLGQFESALDFFQQSLDLGRTIKDVESETNALGNLGLCHIALGANEIAAEYIRSSLRLEREINFRYGEALDLVYLGDVAVAEGDLAKATQLYVEAVAIGEATGDVQVRSEARVGLALSQLFTDDLRACRSTVLAAQAVHFRTDGAVLALISGVALTRQSWQDLAEVSFRQSINLADAQLDRTPGDYRALQDRGLAHTALALLGDVNALTDAVESFHQARRITNAAGVVAATLRLFDLIASVDSDRVRAAREAAAG